MQKSIVIGMAALALSSPAVAQRQDTAATRPVHAQAPDSAKSDRTEKARPAAAPVAVRLLLAARRAEAFMFGADSAVAVWSQRDDPASAALRKVAPVAFWIPVVSVAAVPVVWADEAQDGNRLNATYARNTAAAVAIGFVASRTTKYFVHRARPCTGAKPDQIEIGGAGDTTVRCPAGTHVRSNASFFSEHTMALFAMASAATFQAQRRNAPNAATVAAVGFSSATVFSVSRIYQRQHWLSDVLVGAAVGTASGFLAAQLVPSTR